MKAGVFFTGTGPILILTAYEALNDPNLVEKLSAKGIKKFIAFEVSEEEVKKKYGLKYNVILGDLRQTDDLRVLDYNGHHVFYNFNFKGLGEPIYVEGNES
ncbi:MAG: hypothetical protein JRF17_10645 [Deltaproteobacteria bacterium]|jgi:hypothetical protein|nr:hypothetical protein [Deltaproteobacteria bacterium]MBW2491350.1 hypothetical protein [Deltaproteobacteria bacterium]